MRRSHAVAAVLAVVVGITPLTVGAASAPVMRDTGICIPWIYCPEPTPTPTPTEPEAPVPPLEPTTPVAPVDPIAPDAPVTPVPAPIDDEAPVFTGTPAAMGSEGLSFTGLSGISIVSVPTTDGGSIRALKITAESITITGFSLTVRPPGGPGLVTTADTMSLQGNVTVYIGSISASSMGGEPLTIGTDTPPPLTDVEPGLLDVSMGLVGSIADLITYTNTDQQIVDAG